MVILKKIFVFIFLLFLFSSCSQVSYLASQVSGQMRLQNRAKPNEQILFDPSVARRDKEKILLIQKAKKFFYSRLNLPETHLYESTTFLTSKAATYLVFASPWSDIRPVESCFWLAGCFPYLGFFSKSDALSYEANLQSKGYETYVAPVYAYSTLGMSEDPILSSFFVFEDDDMVEMLFHELVHTVLFMKHDVRLSENLANYFARKLVFEFFSYDETKRSEVIKEKEFEKTMNRLIAGKATKLRDLYKTLSPHDQREAKQIRDEFLENSFFPEIKKACKQQGLWEKSCYPLKREWNNALFSSITTYEGNGEGIEKKCQTIGPDIKRCFDWFRENASAKNLTASLL